MCINILLVPCGLLDLINPAETDKSFSSSARHASALAVLISILRLNICTEGWELLMDYSEDYHCPDYGPLRSN